MTLDESWLIYEARESGVAERQEERAEMPGLRFVSQETFPACEPRLSLDCGKDALKTWPGLTNCKSIRSCRGESFREILKQRHRSSKLREEEECREATRLLFKNPFSSAWLCKHPAGRLQAFCLLGFGNSFNFNIFYPHMKIIIWQSVKGVQALVGEFPPNFPYQCSEINWGNKEELTLLAP